MKKKLSTGKMLLKSLEDALAYHQGKITLRTSTVYLPDTPTTMTPKQIKAIRKGFRVSQGVFARYLGVSGNSIQSWEQGLSQPTGSAARLLEMAKISPEIFQEFIVKLSSKKKAA